MYKVIIADDHLMIREGLKLTIDKLKDFTLVGEAEDGAELIQIVNKQECHLVIIDINMPDLDGIEALQVIKNNCPEVKVVMLSMLDDKKTIQRAVDFGADGYILKDDADGIIQTVLENVMRGYQNFSPRVQSILIKNYQENDNTCLMESLTKREKEILKYLVNGDTHKEISEKTGIAVRTVDFHKRNIKDKLGARNAAELIAISREFDL